MRAAPKDVEEYFSWFPQATQDAMKDVQATILKTAPHAEESISYAMPTYKHHGLLTHFAAYERHIGLYPGSSVIKVFAVDIKEYKSAKGSIQFPLNKHMPLDLIARIVEFRLNENLTSVKKLK